MSQFSRVVRRTVQVILFAGGFLTFQAGAQTPAPAALLESLNEFPHANVTEQSRSEVLDYELGLGAIKKVRGVWQFKASERLSGTRSRYTWQILDGFTAVEVMETLFEEIASSGNSEVLFQCEGNGCGPSVQWANRVFGERLLYGRQEWQRYTILKINGDSEQRLVLYAASRSTERQYLHAELLNVSTP